MALRRYFFSQPELVSNTTVLFMNKSPIACYNTVADMKKYPEFVPWIRGVHVKQSSDVKAECEMTIGFPPIVQSYISNVSLKHPYKIVSVSSANAVFDTLESIWEFFPDKKCIGKNQTEAVVDRCEAHYSIKFKFASILYQNLSSMVFQMVFNETANAFVKRINHVNNIPCMYDINSKTYKLLN